MNPRILRAVIAVVAALAVGIAATLIALHVSAPAKPQSMSVPVLAPFDGTGRSSATTGTATVPAPGSTPKSALDAGAQARADALDKTGGADPLDARAAIGEADSAPSLRVDDPCSTPPAGSDCPGGLRGAIFADTHSEPESLRAYVIADPPLTGTVAHCPVAAEGITVAVPTTVPGTVTLRYWPESNPAEVHSVEIAGVASEQADWEAESAARGGYEYNRYIFQHCTTLTGLASATRYVATAVVIDTFLRVAMAPQVTFDSRGAATEPPMNVVPLTSSLLYVSVPTYRGPSVPDVRAWTVPDGAAADCSSYSTALRLQSAQPARLIDVDASYLRSRNYDAGYTRKSVSIFSVPEGATVVVCARWFDSAAPSWNTTTPTLQRSAVAQSPDGITPTIILERYNLARATDTYAVGVQATTQAGVECGSSTSIPNAGSTGPGEVSVSPGRVLCSESTGRPSHFAEAGVGGNVVINTSARYSGTTTTASYLLPLARQDCFGTCALPAPSRYRIPLPSGAGWVDVAVTWSQGRHNGHDSWVVGAVDPETPGTAASLIPLFDTNVLPAMTLSADGWSASASFVIRTDRHVTWQADLVGDCFPAGSVHSTTGQTFRGSDGSWTSRLEFSGLCPGIDYATNVTMTDDAGESSTAGIMYHDPGRWWPNGYFATPINHLTITGGATARETSTIGTLAWKFDRLSISTDGFLPTPISITGGCVPRATTAVASAPFTAASVQQRIVRVTIVARVTTEGLYYGRSHDSACDWPSPDSFVATADLDIPYADLLRGLTTQVAFTQEDVGPAIYGVPFRLDLTLRGTLVP